MNKCRKAIPIVSTPVIVERILAGVNTLQSQIVDLKQENMKLRAENEMLRDQMESQK